MRVYSLYLSTLGGCQPSMSCTGQIQAATPNTLTVTLPTGGTISNNNDIFYNGIYYGFITINSPLGVITTTINGPIMIVTAAASVPLYLGAFVGGTTVSYITGINSAAQFTVAASAATTMTVTAMTSGTIGLGMTITGTGIAAGTYISAFVTGTGGVGTYTISVATTLLVGEAVTAAYGTGGTGSYLLSATPSAAPTNFYALNTLIFPISGQGQNGAYYISNPFNQTLATSTITIYNYNALYKYGMTNRLNTNGSLSLAKWNINWKEIFGNRTGECRVRMRLISSSSSSLNWVNNVGSVRLQLGSNTSNSTNGFNAAFMRPQSDYTSSVANTTYLDVDSTMSNGVTCVIPNTNSEFTVQILNNTENPMVNVPEYQLWLFFDVDNEDPLVMPNSSSTVPSIFNPR